MAHPLAARLAFFERHWAFFGGFGSVCAVAAVSVLPMSMRYNKHSINRLKWQLRITCTVQISPGSATLWCCSAAGQVALPFYIGAAAMAVLFPLFIIIACDVNPSERADRGDHLCSGCCRLRML